MSSIKWKSTVKYPNIFFCFPQKKVNQVQCAYICHNISVKYFSKNMNIFFFFPTIIHTKKVRTDGINCLK